MNIGLTFCRFHNDISVILILGVQTTLGDIGKGMFVFSCIGSFRQRNDLNMTMECNHLNYSKLIKFWRCQTSYFCHTCRCPFLPAACQWPVPSGSPHKPKWPVAERTNVSQRPPRMFEQLLNARRQCPILSGSSQRCIIVEYAIRTGFLALLSI